MPTMKIALTLSIVALATGSVFAQTPARVLNKDELRTCMVNDPKLAEREKALVASVPPLQAKLAAIRAEGEALNEEQKKVGEYDVRQQIRHDAKRKEFNARVESVNKEAEAVQAERAALTKDVEAHNKMCTGVSYRNEDKAAIEKELGTAK